VEISYDDKVIAVALISTLKMYLKIAIASCLLAAESRNKERYKAKSKPHAYLVGNVVFSEKNLFSFKAIRFQQTAVHQIVFA